MFVYFDSLKLKLLHDDLAVTQTTKMDWIH